ncbi:MAG: RICIN domain-containing protein [Rhodocyclaceae bacterium]|nr:RICIN domain-containing protein [Rhodocyclaceae bacterium]
MSKMRFNRRFTSLAMCTGLTLGVTAVQAQSFLENPAKNALVSGIGLVSGWKCTAGTLTFTVDGGAANPISYGTPRSDVQDAGACAGLNVGFGALLNWGLLSDGLHTIRVFDDGVEFASAEFIVTTFGTDFLSGASGIYKLANFPAAGLDTLVRWDQATQNFQLMKDGGYYKLQTVLSEGRGECLESNAVVAGATLDGASFMSTCEDVTGQWWKVVPMGDGYVQLQSMLSEGRGECLEGNAVAETSTLGGASFMSPCGNFTGQAWKIYPSGNYFQLQTQDAEGRNECLEGNVLAETSTLSGASFMSACGDFTGQLWKLVPR